MTITQYLPQWLRTRLSKPALRKAKVRGKKDRQVLPTLPNLEPPAARWQDDESPAGNRVRWHA